MWVKLYQKCSFIIILKRNLKILICYVKIQRFFGQHGWWDFLRIGLMAFPPHAAWTEYSMLSCMGSRRSYPGTPYKDAVQMGLFVDDSDGVWALDLFIL